VGGGRALCGGSIFNRNTNRLNICFRNGSVIGDSKKELTNSDDVFCPIQVCMAFSDTLENFLDIVDAKWIPSPR